ncbi:unnamed protein product [Withania somnifera]
MLLKIGIKRELSCVHTPLQNGVSERKHRHIVIVEMALTLMINNGVPKHLWVEAFTTAVYLINRLPFSITTLSETSDWVTNNKSSEHSSDSTVQGADNSSSLIILSLFAASSEHFMALNKHPTYTKGYSCPL